MFRRSRVDGNFAGDVIGLRDDAPAGARPLLTQVMQDGRPAGPRPTLVDIRQRFAENFSRLDDRYKRLSDADPFPVELSERLVELQKKC